VKWIASRNVERAAEVADALGARATNDLATAINDAEIDAVDICLPTPVHRVIAERSLAAGKHVFLESPSH
jgi:predicted dehydrogenase